MRENISKYYDHNPDHYSFARRYYEYHPQQKADRFDTLIMVLIGVILWSMILWSI